MKISVFLSSILITQIAFADFAKVKFVKGDVTALRPGAKKAISLSANDKLPEDTSIVTADKSIAKFQLNDGSVLSLGPKSKLVLQKMDNANKSNVIGVLKGVIRAEVTKEKTQDPKLFVKTRSAVMGVRGTAFKAVYNPAQNNTSLVTIEGEVAMAKVEEAKPAEIVEQIKKAEADPKIEAPTQQVVENKPEDLTKVLNENAVSVTQGQFSGVVGDLEKPTAPVKVAPTQLVALVKNDELADKKIQKSEEEIIKEVYTQDEITKDQADKHLTENGELSPRAGGLIDFKTGIYVPPPANSKFDEEKKVFVADEKIGQIDQKGDYIPPKGIVIDEKKGFVVDTKEVAKVASKDELSRLQNQVGFLNNSVEDQVAKDEPTNTSTKKVPFLKGLFKVENHLLSASFIPRSDVIYSENKSNGSELEILSESSNEMNLQWLMKLKNASLVELTLTNRSTELKKPDNFSFNQQYNGSFMGVNLKFLLHLNDGLYGFAGIGGEDQLYVFSGSGNNLNLGRKSVGRFNLGARLRLSDFRKWQVWSQGSLEVYGPTDEGEKGKIDAGAGFNLKLTASYELKNNLKFEGIGYLNRFTQTLNSDYEQTSMTLAFGGNLIWDI